MFVDVRAVLGTVIAVRALEPGLVRVAVRAVVAQHEIVRQEAVRATRTVVPTVSSVRYRPTWKHRFDIRIRVSQQF